MNYSMCCLWLVLCVLAACGARAQEDSEGPLTVSSRLLTVGFSRETGGFVRIGAVGSGHEFIRKATEKAPAWQLVLRDPSGKEASLANTDVPPPEWTSENDEAALRWKGMDLPGETGALDVQMTCRLEPDVDTALIRLRVENRSGKYGLWNVHFPVIGSLSEPGRADIAVGRGTWGMLYEKAEERISGEYPANTLPMQLMLLHEGENGLYLAAHDPQAWFKVFEMVPGKEFRVNTRAADMGVPGNDWESPYPFAIGVYRGDWMTGCKRYRAWALREAPWTRKGPLSHRSDVPGALKNVCAWTLADGAAEKAVPAVKRFAEAVGAPVGVHWYSWHEIPFDTFYPNYLPAKPGFAEGVAELKNAGVVVMPYINARLWDSANENFAEARPFSTKDEKGEVTIEEYGSGAKLAVMCPTQTFWQRKVLDIIQRLGTECGVNAVYMDQIASAPPRVCFDQAHGHSLGSGSWWVDGYRDMLTPIKNWCTSDGREIGLTTENDAEPYMDNVDGLLIWTPRSDHDIPMNAAVYSGYTLYFASNRAFGHGDEAYCLCQARDFTWGTQLGWDGLDILEPAHAGKLEFLARLAKIRSRVLDYVVYGELLEVLQPQNDVPEMTGVWDTPKGDAPVKLKAAHAALWRGRDDSAAVLLANAATEPHEFAFTFNAEPYPGWTAAKWAVSRLLDGVTTDLGVQSGRRFTQSVTVPPRNAVVVFIKPVASP